MTVIGSVPILIHVFRPDVIAQAVVQLKQIYRVA